jgi:hypothetical protein
LGLRSTKFKPKYAAFFNSSSTTFGYISRRERVFDLDEEPGRVILRSGKKSRGAYRWHLAVPASAA